VRSFRLDAAAGTAPKGGSLEQLNDHVMSNALDGMAPIVGGTFTMGSNDHYPEEAPSHAATVGDFWIDRTTVTNAQFDAFATACDYVTSAERPVDPALFPGAPPSLLVPSSVVFRRPDGAVDLRNHFNWWTYVPGADWRHPEGPGSSIEDRMDHPVVHVAFEDVEAYAAWCGKSIPTEAEWEFAARGGLEGKPYVWGDEFTPGGTFMANTWQGQFPSENLLLDGFEGTAPVGSFPPNGYGLFDMAGNVWEWTRDAYGSHAAASSPCCADAAARENDSNQRKPGATPRSQKVLKGGSFLCAPNYCRRYRPAARIAHDADTGTCHTGFRLIHRK
jgi:formylglycine-generating enzyme